MEWIRTILNVGEGRRVRSLSYDRRARGTTHSETRSRRKENAEFIGKKYIVLNLVRFGHVCFGESRNGDGDGDGWMDGWRCDLMIIEDRAGLWPGG